MLNPKIMILCDSPVPMKSDPLLEFKIPDLQVGKSKNLKIKTFDKIKRESSTVIEGVIKRFPAR